uniref:Uncharacterized protein n=1 Tax=Strongyloides stercoralis TaxID=6248 RepID=A0A0K0E3X0_STRER
MLYELIISICFTSSVILSLVKCSKANESPATGKTIPTVAKAKENGLSLKEINGKKTTSTGETKPPTENNNNEKKPANNSVDKFKIPENKDKFAQRKDPNYMTLNGLLDDCFEKTGEKLDEPPKTENKTNLTDSKDFTTQPFSPTLPQKPKNCGIAGSADPQYQTLKRNFNDNPKTSTPLNMSSDSTFDSKYNDSMKDIKLPIDQAYNDFKKDLINPKS